MGYLTDGLSFNVLRDANIHRLPTFKNKHGLPAHSEPDGSDWSPAQWLQAVMGELGEYANLRKKYERGDVSEGEFNIEAGKELADVQIYLDILAFRLGIDLGKATKDKFNEVSVRVGSPVRIGYDDWYYASDMYGVELTKEEVVNYNSSKFTTGNLPVSGPVFEWLIADTNSTSIAK